MNKPTHKQLDSMARLANDADFVIFFGWLNETYLSEAIASTKIDKEPHRAWAQGKVQQVELIIETIRKAGSMIEALNNSQNEQGE